MDYKIYERITEIALHIEKLRDLDEKEQAWIKELLKNGKTVLSCLELLEAIEERSLNYYEIGNQLGSSWQTAKQKLSALVRGGIAITETRDGRFRSPKGGRPRKLSKKKKSD